MTTPTHTKTTQQPILFSVLLARGTYPHEKVTLRTDLEQCELWHGTAHRWQPAGWIEAGTTIELPTPEPNPYWRPEDGPQQIAFYIRTQSSVYRYSAEDTALSAVLGCTVEYLRGLVPRTEA